MSTRALAAPADPQPYDAILLVTFGGPEKPDDVLPFLRNVTAGKGIPDERLVEVGEHYFRFGGKSPINQLTRELVAAIEADLAANGLDLPVYWGCRNWDPYLNVTIKQMAADGVRRALAITTSAYSSYSGCRQYRENLHDAVSVVPGAPVIDKARAYYNHPGYVSAVVAATLAGLEELAGINPEPPTLLFVTHSIPVQMDRSSSPEGSGYTRQHHELMAEVIRQVTAGTGVEHRHELVYCSRSGSPHMPWLEPDINDRIRELRTTGTGAVLAVPFGFISDHMEVIYDLDTEARATADEVGMVFVRAATAGLHPDFVATFRELLLERAAAERGEAPARAVAVGSVVLDRCPQDCCPNPREQRSALCGLDEPVVG